MAMMTYRATMFLVFFNYAMLIMNKIISPAIFPTDTVLITTSNIDMLEGTSIFNSIANMLNVSDISTLLLTAGVLTLFAFSLLIPTIPFIFAFLALSGFITATYIVQLPLPCPCINVLTVTNVSYFTLPLIMGVAIIYYVGISQYAAKTTMQGT